MWATWNSLSKSMCEELGKNRLLGGGYANAM
jgi:hypothetical protein